MNDILIFSYNIKVLYETNNKTYTNYFFAEYVNILVLNWNHSLHINRSDIISTTSCKFQERNSASSFQNYLSELSRVLPE